MKSCKPRRWKGYGNDWPEGHRLCRTCGEVLPFSAFHKLKHGKFGYNSICKPCRIPLSKKNYLNQRPEYKLWYGAKDRARIKGREFTIEISDIVIPEVCPVLKIPMKRPSIDRIDNRRGYTPDNIRVISYRANMLKNNASIEELELVLQYMKSQCDII